MSKEDAELSVRLWPKVWLRLSTQVTASRDLPKKEREVVLGKFLRQMALMGGCCRYLEMKKAGYPTYIAALGAKPWDEDVIVEAIGIFDEAEKRLAGEGG